MNFKNANEAFDFFYKKINLEGIDIANTKAIFNQGFYLSNPLDNEINLSYRKWKKDYADFEWEWYLSQNRSVEEIKQRAKIWDSMHSGDNIVNSNYGWQWNRNNQLEKVIDKLYVNKDSRQAFITIYDGKEIDQYSFDTPCTLNVGFNILHNKLNMSVLMRSNDLWFGFCNDQYCFSKLQEKVANSLEIEIGTYYHFAHNLHIYNKQLNKC
jgi:thymidylate synthase